MKKSKLRGFIQNAIDRNVELNTQVEHLKKEALKWRTNAIYMQNKNATFIKRMAESLGVTKDKVVDAFDIEMPGQVKEPHFDKPKDRRVDELKSKEKTMTDEERQFSSGQSGYVLNG